MKDNSYTITIETVTPIHVGSGEFLSHDSDYVVQREEEDDYIYIVDPRKMIDVIGVENVDKWVSNIEMQRSTIDFVNSIAHKHPKEYSKRSLLSYVTTYKSGTLKECLHDGRGLPYIPGSSIKGAIRTAILSSLSSSNLANLESILHVERNAKKWNSGVEKKVFGTLANKDFMRFIRIGDAYFNPNSEIASLGILLNHREREDLQDKSKNQIIESISTGEKSSFQMKIAQNYNEWCHSKDKEIRLLPNDLSTIEGLMSMINQHTKHLIEEEIAMWSDLSDEYSGAEVFIEGLESVLHEVNSCSEKSCVLRLGYGSGWRFITGAWSEKLSCFDSKVVENARFHANRYTEYEFPKSRRIDEDSDCWGFVKLFVS